MFTLTEYQQHHHVQKQPATVTVIEQAQPNAGLDAELTVCAGTTPDDAELFEAFRELKMKAEFGQYQETFTLTPLQQHHHVQKTLQCTVTVTEQSKPRCRKQRNLNSMRRYYTIMMQNCSKPYQLKIRRRSLDRIRKHSHLHRCSNFTMYRKCYSHSHSNRTSSA